MGLLRALGLARSEEDKRLKALVSQSYSSVRVVGRGTVKIDPCEVSDTSEFKQAREQARLIVAQG